MICNQCNCLLLQDSQVCGKCGAPQNGAAAGPEQGQFPQQAQQAGQQADGQPFGFAQPYTPASYEPPPNLELEQSLAQARRSSYFIWAEIIISIIGLIIAYNSAHLWGEFLCLISIVCGILSREKQGYIGAGVTVALIIFLWI
jgi:hypothetical protein